MRVGLLLVGLSWVVECVLQSGFPGVDRPWLGCRSSLRCVGRHGVLRQVRSVGVNQMGRPRQGWGS
jgi:hypothetical protein